jgi:hypothetical protein
MSTRRAFLAALVGLPATVAFDRAASAHCARTPLVTELLTPTNVPIPSDAALVVTRREGSRDSVEVAFPPVATLVRGPTHIELRAETLAPDVVRLVPMRAPPAGHWNVTGLSAPTAIEIASSPAPAPISPPNALQAVARQGSQVTRYGGTVQFQTLTVRVDRTVPAGLVALVATWGPAGAETEAVMTFASDPTGLFAMQVGNVDLAIVEAPSRCGRSRSGPTPNVGDRLTLTWIDGFGRSLPRSRPLVVQG